MNPLPCARNGCSGRMLRGVVSGGEFWMCDRCRTVESFPRSIHTHHVNVIPPDVFGLDLHSLSRLARGYTDGPAFSTLSNRGTATLRRAEFARLLAGGSLSRSPSPQESVSPAFLGFPIVEVPGVSFTRTVKADPPGDPDPSGVSMSLVFGPPDVRQIVRNALRAAGTPDLTEGGGK